MADIRVKAKVSDNRGQILGELLLGEGTHSIGRDEKSAISVDAEYISWEHARLTLSSEGIFVEDMNSTSGTFIDDVPVRGKLKILTAQQLRVGDIQIQLEPEAGNLGTGSLLAGRYLISRMLGRGGWGEVWLARDEQLDEEVALKRLPPEMAGDAQSISELKRETQKTRRLTHPNIIRIHDLIIPPDGQPFIAMEYVEGTDLATVRSRKENNLIRWQELQPLMVQLCEALDFAHRQKVVHRDIKPSNLMLDTRGNLKLADFGIAASMVDSASRSSTAGMIMGTRMFMSPQQTRGETPQAGDDIYSFGATLYDLLTSRAPFYTGDISYQVIHEAVPSMSARLAELGLKNHIPDYVSAMVMACLQKDPAQRPVNCSGIADWIRTEGRGTTLLTTNVSITAANTTAIKLPEKPPTDRPATDLERPETSTWGTIDSKPNTWYSVVYAIIALLGLILMLRIVDRSAPPKELFALVGIVVLLYIINEKAIGKEKYSCSNCRFQLSGNQVNECPGCKTPLT